MARWVSKERHRRRSKGLSVLGSFVLQFVQHITKKFHFLGDLINAALANGRSNPNARTRLITANVLCDGPLIGNSICPRVLRRYLGKVPAIVSTNNRPPRTIKITLALL